MKTMSKVIKADKSSLGSNESNLNMSEWKWRTLIQRRSIIFPLLNCVMVFAWGILVNESFTSPIIPLNQPRGDNNGLYKHKSNEQPYLMNFAFAVYFCFVHLILLFVIWTTKCGQQIIHEAHGKRLVVFAAFSIFVLVLNFQFRDKFDYINEFEKGSIPAAITIIGFVSFHHIGYTSPLIHCFMYILLLQWLVYLPYAGYSPITIMSVLMCLFVFAFNHFIQEAEHRKVFIGLDTVNVKQLNNETVMRNITCVSREIDAILSEVGLDMRRIETFLNDALFAAIAANDLITSSPAKECTDFTSLCHRSFALLESVTGSALPIFFLEPPEYEITMLVPRGVLELVLVLLLYDKFAHVSSKDIGRERVVSATVSLKVLGEKTGTGMNDCLIQIDKMKLISDNGNGNGDDNGHDDVAGNGYGEDARDRSHRRYDSLLYDEDVDDDEDSMGADMRAMLNRMLPDDMVWTASDGHGRPRRLRNGNGNGNSFERLAFEICHRYLLHSVVTTSEPSTTGGVSSYHHRILLPSSSSSLAKGAIDIDVAGSAAAKRMFLEQCWLFIESESESADRADRDTNNTNIYNIDNNNNNNGISKLTEVKKKLSQLKIPWLSKSTKLSNISQLDQELQGVHQVVVLPQSLLSPIPASPSPSPSEMPWLVVTDHVASAQTLLRTNRFAIDCTAPIDTLFVQIRALLSLLPPRYVQTQRQQDVDVKADTDTQFPRCSVTTELTARVEDTTTGSVGGHIHMMGSRQVYKTHTGLVKLWQENFLSRFQAEGIRLLRTSNMSGHHMTDSEKELMDSIKTCSNRFKDRFQKLPTSRSPAHGHRRGIPGGWGASPSASTLLFTDILPVIQALRCKLTTCDLRGMLEVIRLSEHISDKIDGLRTWLVTLQDVLVTTHIFMDKNGDKTTAAGKRRQRMNGNGNVNVNGDGDNTTSNALLAVVTTTKGCVDDAEDTSSGELTHKVSKSASSTRLSFINIETTEDAYDNTSNDPITVSTGIALTAATTTITSLQIDTDTTDTDTDRLNTLIPILRDMIDAIEAAVWDALLDSPP
eukprot:gene5062-10135_t